MFKFSTHNLLHLFNNNFEIFLEEKKWGEVHLDRKIED